MQRPDTLMREMALRGVSLWLGMATMSTPALAQAPNPLLPHNLSPWGMFLNADIVVKAVMIGLAFASLVTWTIWLAKTIELRVESSRARRRIRMLEEGSGLTEAVRECDDERDAIAQLILSTAREAELSDGILDDGFRERVALRLERVEAAMTRQTSRGTGILATIGATAPFVGLFGTVWGIMNAFIGISRIAHHQSRGCGARHCGSVACHGARARGRDPRGRDLQSPRPGDRRIPRAPGRCLGATAAADQPRTRPSRHGPAARGGVTTMAMRLGTRSSADDLEVLHEINVTPFIDVMLVLLIIFMVAAPLATVDIGVNLPASTAPEQPRPDKPVFITIKPDATIAVGERVVARKALAGALDTATDNHKDEAIFVRADKSLSYGELMEVMNSLRDAGYLKLALVGLEAPVTKR